MLPKVNISIDDISPHPKSSIKVLDRCFKMVDKFTNIKFTLFIPMEYTRYREKSYSILDDKSFCDIITALDPAHFEIGWHGYKHGIIDRSNNDEFRYLNYSEATTVIKKMFQIGKQAGLTNISPILRPSAFRMSPAAIKASWDLGIKLLALSSHKNVKEEYQKEDERYPGKVIYYNVNPPFDPLVPHEQIVAVYHACEWDLNYFSEAHMNELISFLMLGEYEFCFMKEWL